MFDPLWYPTVEVSKVRPNLPADSSPQLTRVVDFFRQPIVILFLLSGLFLFRGIHLGQGFAYDTDETRHIMNGVFVRDLIIDHPVKHLLQYAYDYYAKYPAIALPHWPPLFPIVEGLFFIAFGVSVWVSRLVILCFALLGVYFWYRIAERFGPSSRALISAVIFCFLPTIFAFEHVTMLEVPQVALCLGTIYFWLRWLDRCGTRELWAVAGFAAAAMLTYQMSIFLVLFLGLDFVFEKRFRLLRNWRVWAALGASLLPVIAWYAFSFRALTFSYQRVVGEQELYEAIQTWGMFYYLRTVPSDLGIFLSLIVLVGVGWSIWAAARRYRFLLIWVAAAYICYTLMAEKDPRHILIWWPPLTYFALLGVEALWPWRRLIWIPLVALATYFSIGAWRYKSPELSGLESAARFVMAQPESDIVYYQGVLDGDFIFYVRQLDLLKTHLVARDKQIEVTNIDYAARPVLQTADQVLRFFQTWGIRYALIETADSRADLQTARNAIHSDAFELIGTFPIQLLNESQPPDSIEVYRFRGPSHRAESVDIPMMTIHHNVHIDLQRLAGRPWPN